MHQPASQLPFGAVTFGTFLKKLLQLLLNQFRKRDAVTLSNLDLHTLADLVRYAVRTGMVS